MYQNTQHLANSKRKEMIEFVCINSCITLSLPNRQEQQPATLLRYNSSSQGRSHMGGGQGPGPPNAPLIPLRISNQIQNYTI